MSTENHTRTAIVTYFPMFIATLSLCASAYSAYLFSRSVEATQRNVNRFEVMRSCRDVIDVYFQVKLKAGLIAAGGPGAAAAENDAVSAVAKLGALGTYMANFADGGARERYTKLTHELARIVQAARTTPRAEIDKLFEAADPLFAGLNDDCVHTAHQIM